MRILLVMNNDIPVLHLLMGLPGSGKSTLGSIIQDYTDGARLSSDEYRLMVFPDPKFTLEEHDELYLLIDHNVEHLLEFGRTVIYDANLNRRHHRDEKYDLAEKYNVKTVLWWVDAPVDLAKKRRLEEQNPVLIPDGETAGKMFDRIAAVIEPPDPDEVYIKVDGAQLDNDSYIEKIKKKLATLQK